MSYNHYFIELECDLEQAECEELINSTSLELGLFTQLPQCSIKMSLFFSCYGVLMRPGDFMQNKRRSEVQEVCLF